jgi:hypothetical protein
LIYNIEPSIIVIDADGALINAIKAKIPIAQAFLCQWHIQKNVLKHCKVGFATNEEWDKFEKAFNGILYTPIEEEYKDRLAKFSITYTWNKNLYFIDDYIEYIK